LDPCVTAAAWKRATVKLSGKEVMRKHNEKDLGCVNQVSYVAVW
jgi:hypothetical protein